MSYINGLTIQKLRKEKNLTQKQLAQTLLVSDKTVSKWETNRGLPDITILPELASALGVSDAELMTGEIIKNENTFYFLIAYGTDDSIQFKKLYPEQNAECSFKRCGHGIIYAYCNRHGLLYKKSLIFFHHV